VNQDDGERDADGGNRQRAQRAGAELLVHAALGKQRQSEAGLDHALLRREAVDRDDLRRAQTARGEGPAK
jgi:hypothetical protein